MAERVVATTAVETRAGLQKRPAFKKPLRAPGRTIEDVLRHIQRHWRIVQAGEWINNSHSFPRHEKKTDEVTNTSMNGADLLFEICSIVIRLNIRLHMQKLINNG